MEKKELIDLGKDAIYIVQNGMKTTLTPKNYGEDTIIWKNGKVLDVDRSERIRIKGKEVI